MKTFNLPVLLGLMISAAAIAADFQADSAPEFVSATNRNGKIWLTEGFRDSSFDYSETNPNLASKAICFNVDLASACASLEKAIESQLESRDSGEHDFLEFIRCETKKFGIEAKYILSDDYSPNPIEVTRNIYACNGSGAATTAQSSLYQAWTHSNERVYLYSGFYRQGGLFADENGQVATKFCYSGNADEVCSLVHTDAARSLDEYLNGDHFYVEVKSCEVQSKGQVQVDYVLNHDYADAPVDVTSQINPCLK